MENKQTKRELLKEIGLEDSIVFENPDYDANNYKVIYDFQKTVQHLMENDNMEYDEAVEFIDYNTLRALPYIGGNSPIIMNSIDEYM